MDFIILPILGGILWRLRGQSHGWMFAALFAFIASALLYYHLPNPAIAVAFFLWVWFGERPGWGAAIGRATGHDGTEAKKRAEWYQRMFDYWLWDRPWLALAFRGFLIGGIGAIAMPIAVKASMKIPDPPVPRNWHGAWWEFYFGAIFMMIEVALVNTLQR